ncbi:zinc finger XlCGF71.1-like, partial [Argonauta hians]
GNLLIHYKTRACFVHSFYQALFAKTFRSNIFVTMDQATPRLFQCVKCQKDFVSYFTLHVHQLFHHKPKTSHCYVCKKDFLNSSYLKLHQTSSSHDATENVKPFGCLKCGKNFVSDFTLKLHQLIHSSQKPFHCNACNKDFLNDSALIQHRKIHDKKPFPCKKCGQNFTKASLLKLHLKLHYKRKAILLSRMKYFLKNIHSRLGQPATGTM